MKIKIEVILVAALLVMVCLVNSNAEPMKTDSSKEEVKNIVKHVYSSVVKVETRNHLRKVATGVVIDKEGHVLTTALVTPLDEKLFINTADGKKIEAEFVGMDPETHLAVVRAKEGVLTPIKIQKKKQLAVGDWIGVVGISPENTPAVTQGIVSSVGEDKLRLNVWVVPGSSGSPVVDKEGQMVGIIRGIYVDEGPLLFQFEDKVITGTGYSFSRAEAPSSGMAVAVPVDIVVSVADEIKEKGKVERGWLGVSIQQNEEGLVEIIEVEKESPAELAKLHVEDILLEIEKTEIISTEMLAQEIRKRKPGDDITLTIERSGKKMKVDVKLGEYQKKDILKEFEIKFPDLFSKDPKFTKSLPKLSFVRKGHKYIGIYIEELNRDLSEYFGIPEGTGLLISKIMEDSPAESAGLQVGDVIFKADGERISYANAFTNLIQKKEKGDTILIEFLRDKKASQAEVEIAEDEDMRKGFFGFQDDLVGFEWQTRPFNKNEFKSDFDDLKKEQGSADKENRSKGNKKEKGEERLERLMISEGVRV